MALTLSNDGSLPQVTLPLNDAQETVNLNSIEGGNNQLFALRFALDAPDGSLDLLNLHNGVTVLGHDLQCFPGIITKPPDRLVIRHPTSAHSLFDLDAVQAFATTPIRSRE